MHEALAAGKAVRVKLVQQMMLPGRCLNTISWTPLLDHTGKVMMYLTRLDSCEPLQPGQPANPQFAEVVACHELCVEDEEEEMMDDFEWCDMSTTISNDPGHVMEDVCQRGDGIMVS